MSLACSEMESKNERDPASPTDQDLDKDLQLIFKKLRVDSQPKRLCRKSRVRSRSWSEGSKRIPLPKRKVLIQEPTFVYKSKCATNFRSQAKKLRKFRNKKKKLRNDLASPVSGPVSDTLFTSEQLQQNQNQQTRRRYPSASCSGQFRRAQLSTLMNQSAVKVSSDDTTPDELAAYFELLHIPKPMSAMAEMMYT